MGRAACTGACAWPQAALRRQPRALTSRSCWRSWGSCCSAWSLRAHHLTLQCPWLPCACMQASSTHARRSWRSAWARARRCSWSPGRACSRSCRCGPGPAARAPPGKPRLAAAGSPAARTKRSRLPVAPACSLSPGLYPAPARLAHVSLPLALHTPRSTRVPLLPAPDAPRWAAMAPFGAERGARQATATATASASVAAAPTAVSGTPISGANTTVSGAPAGTAAAAASATATPAAPLLVCRPAYLQLTVYPGARRPAGPVLPCCRSARRRRP